MKIAPLAFALLSALLVLGASDAREPAAADGSVTIGDQTWRVADAVATRDGEELTLVFAQKRFDRAAWAEDGEFGTFDLWEFEGEDDHGAQSLSIRIDNDSGGYGGHNIKTGSGGGGGYDSSHADSLTLTARDDKHVAGTLKLDADDLAAEVRFDVPIQAFGPLARAGTALPASGGEPGKVLLAVVEATHAGDLDRMIALSHPDRRARLEQAKAAGEAEDMLEMAKLFTPKIGKITGGSVDGDTAFVDFLTTGDGAEATGTAELTRVDGTWYVKGINTKQGG